MEKYEYHDISETFSYFNSLLPLAMSGLKFFSYNSENLLDRGLCVVEASPLPFVLNHLLSTIYLFSSSDSL